MPSHDTLLYAILPLCGVVAALIALAVFILARRADDALDDWEDDCTDFNEVRARPFGHGFRPCGIEPAAQSRLSERQSSRKGRGR